MSYLSGNLPQHAYTIPYHFTDTEARDWIGSQADNIPLQSYLANATQTPAGLVFPDGYAQILVWVDASAKTHVVDVTNMSVANHVNEASYQSPDSSIVGNVYEEVVKLIRNVATATSYLPYIAIGIGVVWALTR